MSGEILKKRREDLNLTIRGVAEELKIKGDYLNAIEQDAFEKLPVAVYTRGYIRAYADYLGVDAGPILDVYSTHLSQPEPSTIIPVASSTKKGHRFLKVVLSLLVLSIAFFGYFYGKEIFYENVGLPEVPKPDRQIPVPVQNPASLPVASPSGVPLSAPAVTSPVSIPAQTAETALKQSAVQVRRDHVLRITATELTWLSVRIGEDRAEEVTLRPGDTKTWQFPDRAVLRVGNAGGITVDLDEKTVSPLGSRGQVLNLVLPPEGN